MITTVKELVSALKELGLESKVMIANDTILVERNGNPLQTYVIELPDSID